jgi:pyruvate dehydrogenase E2 component (dihydrolipoamide acetyltransferase)
MMPRLSDSMEEGTIVRWLKRDGDEVARGEELVEIETDKATLAYESDAAGTLQITAQEGATLPVGAKIALIGGDDSVPSAAPAKTASGDETSGRGAVTTTEPTRTQALIARRMAESRATVPSFTLQISVDMTTATTLRAEAKAVDDAGQAVPTINDMVVKAAALALREQPQANGAWRDGKFEHYSRVNIGVAVAGPGTLVVPTVFDADAKTLAEISAETGALAERVRSGTITPPQTSGGTFTVSNLGMFGVRSFEAVINTPQAAILAVGAVEQRAAVHEGEIEARMLMELTLACDHRILYGADGAKLLARIKALLEAPLSLAS